MAIMHRSRLRVMRAIVFAINSKCFFVIFLSASWEQPAPVELVAAPTVGDLLTVPLYDPRPEITIYDRRHSESIVERRVVNTILTGEFFAADAVGVLVLPT